MSSDGDPSGDRQRELRTEVYNSLHEVAVRHMHKQAAGHTLQATALVHEAWMRLAQSQSAKGAEGAEWNGDAHFSQAAAKTMRDVLVDHARKRQAVKRTAPDQAPTAMDVYVDLYAERIDLIALDEALEVLTDEHPEWAQLVELHFFAGHTLDETAAIMGRSPATVDRHWREAKQWIKRRLAEE